MRRIELETLYLRNFKGVRRFSLSLGRRSAHVYGQNAAGKTTLSDAVHFLLFGIDSAGRKQFDIKTLDSAGKTQKALEHTVEGTFSVDGELISLQRTYKENWVRPRGRSQDELDGHTTVLHIDGVPVQLNEYTQRVSEILDEGTWRLISDPAAFPRLPWQKRRAMLLEIIGDITDSDVIASDPNLAELPGILGKRTLEEHRKVVDARRSEINKELVTLPARIDEVHQGMPELPASTQVELQAVIDDLVAKRGEIEAERSRIESGGETAELQKRLTEIKTSVLDVERRIRSGVDEQLVAERRKLTDIESEDDKHRLDTRPLTQELQDSESRITWIDRRLNDLREEYQQIAAMKAPEHSADSCSACGQALPAEQVQAAHEKALAKFNSNRAEGLEVNQTEGKKRKAERDQLTARQAELQKLIAAAAEKAEEISGRTAAQREVIAQLQASTPDATQDPEYQQLTAEAQTVGKKLEELRDNARSAVTEVAGRLSEVDAELTELRASLSLFSQHERAQARVQELEAQELKLTAEFERLERELYLMDEFTRTRVALLESSIASHFDKISFRLFRNQVNGGLAEVCDMTVDGVPFDSVNRAGQIAAGLDVIKALQRHHGVSAPVWIDGAESISDIPDTGAQQVALIVSSSDPTLRVVRQATEVTA